MRLASKCLLKCADLPFGRERYSPYKLHNIHLFIILDNIVKNFYTSNLVLQVVAVDIGNGKKLTIVFYGDNTYADVFPSAVVPFEIGLATFVAEKRPLLDKAVKEALYEKNRMGTRRKNEFNFLFKPINRCLKSQREFLFFLLGSVVRCLNTEQNIVLIWVVKINYILISIGNRRE